MDIAPESESYVEKCFVSLVNEKLDVVEKLSSVDSSNSTSAARECSIYVDLYPGQRYEVSAKTISENASSNIISKSFALQPAFDMETFGLQLLVMDIAPESESYVEKCFVSLVNEKLDVVEKLSSVDSSNSTSAARE
ncbi:hypothetical protein WUBG_17993 [Wuchereria bancrofti]|uniref:Dep-1 fourth Fn3-like domain-containing protein n=1 Tax=Wuchereria bancrofti TaxID=6293 RepID=J9DNA6_WUCBA|nr:hypothetical protein WUBG_17993 [Wuchereria bancrofti]